MAANVLIYSFAGVKLFPYHFGLNISQMYVRGVILA
jgi:hypothetical protein